MNRFGDVDGDAIFQETKLLQSLTALERRLRKRAEAIERGLAVGVKAQVLEIADAAGVVAIEWDARAGKIQGAAMAIGHDFHRVGIVDILRRARSLHGANIAARVLH